MPVSRRLTSAEIRRKTNKPIMEKKRRERINNSLEELKSIVLRSVNEESRPNKLEKADILEMTVRYIRSINPSVHLKDEKDNILYDRTRSGIQPMVRQDYPKSATGFTHVELPRSSHPFENRENLHYTPYYRPHFVRTAPMSASHHIPALLNPPAMLDQFMRGQSSSCLNLCAKQYRRYPPIPTSPVSSASSESPAPMSPSDDCYSTNERKSCESMQLNNGRGNDSATDVPLPVSNEASSPAVPKDSNEICPAVTLPHKEQKTVGIIWRPWRVVPN